MSRAAALSAAAFLLAGCAKTIKHVSPIEGPPPQPPVVPYVVPVEANFIVTVSEAVADADEDVSAFTKVFVDGKPAGQTEIAPKSKEKKWGLALPDGNHLIRFEQWYLPLPGEWTPLGPQWQPEERFIRVERGLRTLVALKFSDGERRYSLQISREPIPVPAPPPPEATQ